MLIKSNLTDVKSKIASKETFVLNIVAQWCPDCTERQAQHLTVFAEQLSEADLDIVELKVQEERLVFLSPEHEEFVETLGGHGYPRTVLIKAGEAVDSDNVEMITEQQLSDLATRFKGLV